MFGVARFDPNSAGKTAATAELAPVRGDAGPGPASTRRQQARMPRTNHLSGSARRKMARAKQAEHDRISESADKFSAKLLSAKARVGHPVQAAVHVPRPTRVSSSDPRRRSEKRRVQDRLDAPNPLPKFPEMNGGGNTVSVPGMSRGGTAEQHVRQMEDQLEVRGGKNKVRRTSQPGGLAAAPTEQEAQTDQHALEQQRLGRKVAEKSARVLTEEERQERIQTRKKKKKEGKKKKERQDEARQAAAEADAQMGVKSKVKGGVAFEMVRKRAAAAQQLSTEAAEADALERTEWQDDVEDEKEPSDKEETDGEGALTLNELQERLATATSTRPTPQYLNEQQQLAFEENAGSGINVEGLPSWLVHGQRVLIEPPKETEREEEQAGANSGPTLLEAKINPQLAAAAEDRLGVTRLFPAQAAAIPAILNHRGDILVSAPTGSGKTLIYVLPLLQALHTRVQVRLRALVLLPTRDLAMQVHAVIQQLIEGSGLDLRLGDACGGLGQRAGRRNAGADGEGVPLYEQNFDIVVGTPGRIVALMRDHAAFCSSLRELEWLVIDDADRLLQQSHQAWLPRLMRAIEGDTEQQGEESGINGNDAATDQPTVEAAGLQMAAGGFGAKLKSKISQGSWLQQNLHVSSVKSAMSQGLGGSAMGFAESGLTLCNWLAVQDPKLREVEASLGWRRGSVRKLVLSATLTRHPAKLHALRLHRPRSIRATAATQIGESSDTRYSLPTTLIERAAVVPQGAKPLALIIELLMHRDGNAVDISSSATRAEKKEVKPGCIVFAATVETSHRLARLLQLYGGFAAAEYSSRLKPAQRQAALQELASGKLGVLVCSDVLSRGIDIAGKGVGMVINYDSPSHAKTYVHRVGRTARAGRVGIALSLLERQDVRFFTALRRKAALPALKPEPIARFRSMLLGTSGTTLPATIVDVVEGEDEDDGDEVDSSAQENGSDHATDLNSPSERCRRCLAELESVLSHESMALLQHHTPVQQLPATVEQNEMSMGRDNPGNWGRQLFELQRTQIMKNAQQSLKAKE